MAKAKKKTPKRIAGVKLPKPVRRGLDELLTSDTGRDIVANVIVAAGAALATDQAQKGSATRELLTGKGKGAKAAVRDAKDKAGAVPTGSAALAYALGEAGRAFTEALSRGKAEADARAAWPPIEGSEDAEPKARKAKPEPEQPAAS